MVCVVVERKWKAGFFWERTELQVGGGCCMELLEAGTLGKSSGDPVFYDLVNYRRTHQQRNTSEEKRHLLLRLLIKMYYCVMQVKLF